MRKFPEILQQDSLRGIVGLDTQAVVAAKGEASPQALDLKKMTVTQDAGSGAAQMIQNTAQSNMAVTNPQSNPVSKTNKEN